MPPLSSALRGKLERTIIAARDVAEAGADAALKALAVNHHEPFPHQKPEERKLRNHLRAHARQLGDHQDESGKLHLSHLVQECAYEHWHRMIFARFLAENDLLIEPTHGMAISLQECKELADQEKVDLWVYASRCAQQMLPQIFRADDPLLQVKFAANHRVPLETLLDSLPSELFKADDSLGWVYQFWQSKKKDEVNNSEEKITGDTLPAVTQLFTEHYMVLFLLHNTLGAWHAGKVLTANPKLAETAKDEDELRRAVALKAGGVYSFDYLRFVRGADGKTGPWRPAAGVFEGWPKKASELKVLDPCCGSGHFLAAAFDLVFRLRMEEENSDLASSVNAALQDNIFGLELDARCTQIAAFNLALSAWKQVGWSKLPPLHIACSGIGVNATKEQWLKLANGNEELMFPLGQLWELFQKAPVLGSLINPNTLPKVQIGKAIGFNEIRPLLEKAVKLEVADDVESTEISVTAQGVVKAAEILANHFTLVITNVPYLGRAKQDGVLKKYCEVAHPNAKADLATCFVERCIDFCSPAASIALVTPHNWLFLGRYTKLRELLLGKYEFNALARLGAGAFETISGEIVNVVLQIVSRRSASPTHEILGCNASESRIPLDKASALRAQELNFIAQHVQLNNPDSKIVLEQLSAHPLITSYAETAGGMCTFDSPCFYRRYWELPVLDNGWVPLQTTVDESNPFNGRHLIVRWENGKGQLYDLVQRMRENGYTSGIWCAGLQVWGKRGVLVSLMGSLPVTLYEGTAFDNNCAVLIPNNPTDIAALWAFCSAPDFNKVVRNIDQALKVTSATIGKIPFDIEHWRKIASAIYPQGLPTPFSSDPIQWIFNGSPKDSNQPLHVAIARLLGYKWPRQTGSSFPDCPTLGPDSLEKFSDDDGIVCIPSVRGESTAADRLSTMLATCGIKPDCDLDEWLRDSFFEEHCKLFHHRPFIWHIWDGRKRDGFHALVNYHKLAGPDGKKLLESLTYSYLGDWISRQQDGVKNGEEGAEDRLAAALELQKRLVSILKGEPPFDIFVRWKPLSRQPIGWEPDINDGVRINIRPFLASDLPNGRAGAGILRWKPNIKWDKDRGREPKRPKDEFPWFWNGNDFTGDRVNEFPLSVEEKQKARIKNKSV